VLNNRAFEVRDTARNNSCAVPSAKLTSRFVQMSTNLRNSSLPSQWFVQ